MTSDMAMSMYSHYIAYRHGNAETLSTILTPIKQHCKTKIGSAAIRWSIHWIHSDDPCLPGCGWANLSLSEHLLLKGAKDFPLSSIIVSKCFKLSTSILIKIIPNLYIVKISLTSKPTRPFPTTAVLRTLQHCPPDCCGMMRLISLFAT